MATTSIFSPVGEIEKAIKNARDFHSDVSRTSVARAANAQSFIYPCLIDDTIPVDMAATLTRNLDRVYAAWTQIYLSSIGIIDLNYIRNPKEFIQKYQPTRMESADDYLLEDGEDEEDEDEFLECDEELRDTLYGDDEILVVEDVDGNEFVRLTTPGNFNADVKRAMKKAMHPYMSEYNLGGINGSSLVTEATAADNQMLNAFINASRREQDSKQLADFKNAQAPRMSDSDVKKLNDMQPYVIDLRLMARNGEGGHSMWVNYAVGVKTNLHLAKSDILMMHIVDALRNRDKLFNFFKWTTGEISLWRDIILHLDEINFDVAAKSDRTGKFITKLKEMKKQKLKLTPGKYGVSTLPPIATIAISSSTYQEIKSKYGFDLKNVAFANKLMNNLFLMCFVVLDDTTRTVDIMVDGNTDFHVYSLDTLEREVTMNSSKLSKELTRMLGSN